LVPPKGGLPKGGLKRQFIKEITNKLYKLRFLPFGEARRG